jgi:hypothetical protein
MSDDTQFTDEPVCPYCGHVHRDAWEINFGPGLEGDTDIWCGECGEQMHCSRSVAVSYSTSKCEPTTSQAEGETK